MRRRSASPPWRRAPARPRSSPWRRRAAQGSRLLTLTTVGGVLGVFALLAEPPRDATSPTSQAQKRALAERIFDQRIGAERARRQEAPENASPQNAPPEITLPERAPAEVVAPRPATLRASKPPVVPGPPPKPSSPYAALPVAETSPATSANSVCGDPRIRGVVLQPIDDGGACQAFEPVSIASINGVRFTPVAVAQCPLARRLADWIDAELQPAAQAAFDAPVAEIVHYSAYTCRDPDPKPGARISLHSSGAALDIGALLLADERRISVKQDWGGDGPAGVEAGVFLRHVWTSACGPFTTVLGPESDAAHEDHFHLDVAPRREPYCR